MTLYNLFVKIIELGIDIWGYLVLSRELLVIRFSNGRTELLSEGLTRLGLEGILDYVLRLVETKVGDEGYDISRHLGSHDRSTYPEFVVEELWSRVSPMFTPVYGYTLDSSPNQVIFSCYSETGLVDVYHDTAEQLSLYLALFVTEVLGKLSSEGVGYSSWNALYHLVNAYNSLTSGSYRSLSGLVDLYKGSLEDVTPPYTVGTMHYRFAGVDRMLVRYNTDDIYGSIQRHGQLLLNILFSEVSLLREIGYIETDEMVGDLLSVFSSAVDLYVSKFEVFSSLPSPYYTGRVSDKQVSFVESFISDCKSLIYESNFESFNVSIAFGDNSDDDFRLIDNFDSSLRGLVDGVGFYGFYRDFFNWRVLVDGATREKYSDIVGSSFIEEMDALSGEILESLSDGV